MQLFYLVVHSFCQAQTCCFQAWDVNTHFLWTFICAKLLNSTPQLVLACMDPLDVYERLQAVVLLVHTAVHRE